MHLPKERIAYLLETYTSKKATAQEEQELMEWMHNAQEDSDLKTYIEKLWNNYQPGITQSQVDWDSMFHRIVHNNEVHSIAPEPKNKINLWSRIAVAAAILILVLSGTYLLWSPRDTDKSVAENIQQPELKDVEPPLTNKATLRLANGKIIVLDNAGTGSLSSQGVANATRLNEDLLAYSDIDATAIEFHTLAVPKGSKPMRLQLADGSEVWLNASSSITFPNIFTGEERKVTVTGETYFEVKHDAKHAFIVSKGETQIRVLGTKFNVNAYDDEEDLKITLLEGSVKVSNGHKEAMLRPGQQARLANNDIKLHGEVNLNEVMAWKNGVFEFNETDIQTIMRQIERWYGVEVVFERPLTQHFNGTIQRQVNVSRVLNMLEKTGGIRFSVEDKKVIVKKY